MLRELLHFKAMDLSWKKPLLTGLNISKRRQPIVAGHNFDVPKFVGQFGIFASKTFPNLVWNLSSPSPA